MSCFLLVTLCALAACCTGRSGEIRDFYGEYSLTLPFDLADSYNAGGVLFFTTDYELEQMAELLRGAGYGASLHTNDETDTILISATQNGFVYYFVIFDKTPDDARFSMSAAASLAQRHPFLAPIHILEPTPDDAMWRFFGGFEQLASFYRATGKNDVVIDEAAQRIYFDNANAAILIPRPGIRHDLRQGTIILSLIGDYLQAVLR
jgi:hypothetical protein